MPGQADAVKKPRPRCPVCDAEPTSPPMELHGSYVLHRCRRCDVQFADPLEEPGQQFYETHWRYSGPEIHFTSPRALNWDQRCFLRDRPRPGGRLLDVGCGTGYFAAAAQRAGYHVTGLDLNRNQLEIARRSFGLADLHAMTLAEFARGVPAGSLDVVTAFQVLEHVAAPMDFVGEAARLVRPGGYFAVGVPNWRVWRAFREPLDCPPHHLTRWSAVSLAHALDRGGLQVVSLREHRSAYSFLLRHARLGLLRRVMERSRSESGAREAHHQAVVALSVIKTRLLVLADLPARALLTALRVPGGLLYALARRPG